MKRNSIILIIAVAFICTNMATFLYARGKAQIAEKLAVPKAADITEVQALKVSGIDKKLGSDAAYSNKANTNPLEELKENAVENEGNDNADYGVSEETNSQAPGETANVAEKKVEEADNSNTPQEETAAAGGTFSNTNSQDGTSGTYYYSYDGSNASDPDNGDDYASNEEESPFPLPQFPSSETDYEVQGDDEGAIDIAMPELPKTNN